jgi:hypothetical protein
MHLTTPARSLFVRSGLILLIAFICFTSQAIPQQRKESRVQPGKQQSKQKAKSRPSVIPPEIQAALDRIEPQSLRGHLSFIASDLLEGRDTPSRGQDIAAEYIAAQFRRAGLDPVGEVGEQSYFQTSEWTVSQTREKFITLTCDEGKQSLRASRDQLSAYGITIEQKPAESESSQTESGVVKESQKQSIKLRNVIGLLPGSDPVMKDTYVIVSAHYDHIGMRVGAEGDMINNGANDDGSGTVSVIELASALASLKQRPKRSIVFITWFGEERGFQGSRYYVRHPVFPLEKTVAMINLEHMGRTDDSEGPKLKSATMTGFDFTDMGSIFKAAGDKVGVKVYKHEKNSDAFFGRSDNQALANAGVPAHTLCVAFIFPDYHAVGDHWDKVDYDNMAIVDRMIALGIIMIANNPEAPKWNETNQKTERYVKAWRSLHKGL